MNYDVVTIGDAVEDVFVEPDLKPRLDKSFLGGKAMSFEFGEKITLNNVQFEIGGSACNAAVGFSRLGYKSSIIAMLGEDEPAKKIVSRLKKEKVDASNLVGRSSAQTGYSVIFSVKGERTIFVFHGPKDYKDIKIAKDLETDWFYVSPLGHNTDELERDLVAFVSEKGSKIAWNPGAIQIKEGASHFRHLLKCTEILFVNREEAIRFIDLPIKPEIREVMKRLHSYGPRIVVVTDGKEGARAYDGDEFYDIQANMRVDKVDVTGAGDSFAVGFLGSIMSENDQNIQKALKWGIKNSASVIQYMGAQRGLLSKKIIM